MNKEEKVWFLISIVGGIIFAGLMTTAVVYDIRFKYDFYIAVLTYCIMFVSFMMYAFTRYISTREIVSILTRKVCDW